MILTGQPPAWNRLFWQRHIPHPAIFSGRYRTCHRRPSGPYMRNPGLLFSHHRQRHNPLLPGHIRHPALPSARHIPRQVLFSAPRKPHRRLSSVPHTACPGISAVQIPSYPATASVPGILPHRLPLPLPAAFREKISSLSLPLRKPPPWQPAVLPQLPQHLPKTARLLRRLPPQHPRLPQTHPRHRLQCPGLHLYRKGDGRLFLPKYPQQRKSLPGAG